MSKIRFFFKCFQSSFKMFFYLKKYFKNFKHKYKLLSVMLSETETELGDIGLYVSYCHFIKAEKHFKTFWQTADNYVPFMVELSKDEELRKKILIFAHELGHIIAFKNKNICPKQTEKQFIKLVSDELLAWRVAKTILKPEFWDEDLAQLCLTSYLFNIRCRPSKIKILPFKNINDYLKSKKIKFNEGGLKCI